MILVRCARLGDVAIVLSVKKLTETVLGPITFTERFQLTLLVVIKF